MLSDLVLHMGAKDLLTSVWGSPGFGLRGFRLTSSQQCPDPKFRA